MLRGLKREEPLPRAKIITPIGSVQVIAEIFDPAIAAAYGPAKDERVVPTHCGSRGLGRQIEPPRRL
ncbi:hypothetical protein D1O30_20000 [Methylocystis hirsuta]|uniref:3'-phosphate/5'-hydroxy nucleic acid ligase n=1 Tax=Methylocystis hirsuta TaxID=369798 RepID=A0A3M9XKF3_9HYPH|nr:hypothetical protein D1O30_20000 [Methylocystis hirsuta]